MDTCVLQKRHIFATFTPYTLRIRKGLNMQTIYLIDHKGKFRGAFPSIRDAKYYALHEHINNYYLKRIKKRES